MLIIANVKNKVLSIPKGADGLTPAIVCHNKDYKIKFTLDAEWDGISAKTARFIWADDEKVSKVDTPFTGDEVDVPEVARTKELVVGIFAEGIHTTTPGTIICKPSILCEDGNVPDPAPEVYNEIMRLINEMGASGGALPMTGATAEEDGTQGLVPQPKAGDQDKVLYGDGTWRTPEGGGTGAGAPGADGGYYTPSVKDNGNGTMTVSFTASKEGMAVVNPVTIVLPVPADGEDGQDGQDGADGGYYTPSAETVTDNTFKISFAASKSGMPAVGDVTITLPTAKDGEDGKDGTSVTISSVTESTESGGSNVVEFSDGKSITIKNGKDGKDYILTDDDKTEIIQEILAELGAAVIGYIDGNTITVKGNLAEGTYTAYYEVDGELVEIGELTLAESGETPEPTTYTVTFMADGVTVDAVEYQEGDTALERVPDVPAKDGYTGVWETYDISNGGNITVNAVYTQIPVTPTYTNLFTAGTAKLNTRIAGTGELKTDTNATGKVTTDFITIPSDKLPFEATTKIYIKGATFTADGNTKIATYLAATGTDYSAMYSGLNGGSISTVDEGNGVISASGIDKSFPASVKRMALTLKVKDTAITAGDVAGIVITIDEPIKNLLPSATDASGNAYNGTKGWKTGYRLSSSSGSESPSSGIEVTGFMPVKYGQTIELKNITTADGGTNCICFYNGSRTYITGGYLQAALDESKVKGGIVVNTDAFKNITDAVKYFRFSATEITTKSVVTVTD